MNFAGPLVFDEKGAVSWRLASGAALVLAIAGLRISPEFSLINAAISLSAGLVSLVPSGKVPKGALAAWVILVSGFWLSPLAHLEPELLRTIFGAAIVAVSLVYQGPVALFFFVMMLGFGLSLQSLSLDLGKLRFIEILLDDSFQFLQLSSGIGITILFLRISRSRTNDLHRKLQKAADELEKSKARVSRAQDAVQVTRENLLGRAGTDGEVTFSETISDSPLDQLTSFSSSFDKVIQSLRQSFAEFQLRGRADGRISGPIRFVFFQPAAGYDETSLISVDLDALVKGVDACLELALESLPETGKRKREGVIRLSIRYGLRVIEISVEDNGRGLVARNPESENKLRALKDLCSVWGGTFDRVARMGVGSRTSLELRIVRERSRAYRATLKHQIPVSNQSLGVPRG